LERIVAGHSKWANIKHKKGRADAKRGKLFSRLIKEITVAARLGGGDINGNPRLRAAVQAGKEGNMPSDNMERAIKKGTGELEGVSYEESLYEGYGPSGVAVLVETVTDNKTRTVADVRHIFTKFGGSLAEPNAVAWQFDRVGAISVAAEGQDEESLMMQALECGATDFSAEDELFIIQTSADDLFSVLQALEDSGIESKEANLSYVAQNMMDLEVGKANSVLKLLDALDDCDDVQQVHTNASIPDEAFEA
jgi:YebC/PmpR family DNA-binding regulatory protein